jgi:transposase
VKEIGRKPGVSEPTFCGWKTPFAGGPDAGLAAARAVGRDLLCAARRHGLAIPAALPPAAPDGLSALGKRVEEVEAAIVAWHKESEASRRLAEVPGIGPITASAIVATVGDVSNFASARHFAAWIGLVPKQDGTGGEGAVHRRP